MYQWYTQPYHAPSSRSQGSYTYHAFGSRASTSRPSQDRGRDMGKAPAQAYTMHISDHHDTTIGMTIDCVLLISSS